MSRRRASARPAFARLTLVVLAAVGLAACSAPAGHRAAPAIARAASHYVDPRGTGVADQVEVPTPGGGVSLYAHYDPTRHGAPWIMYVHGGYWREGDGQMPNWSEQHRVAGFQVFSVVYRLSQVATWPGPLDDVEAAVGFVRAHAARFGLDPKRGALMGFSAGGLLATVAGLQTHVAGIVDLDGAVDPLAALTQNRTLGQAALQLLGCAPITCPAHWQDPRTMTHIDADSPPMLVVHSVHDPAVPYAQSVTLVAALRRAHRPVQFLPVPGDQHSTDGIPAVAQRVDRFLKQVTSHSVG